MIRIQQMYTYGVFTLLAVVTVFTLSVTTASAQSCTTTEVLVSCEYIDHPPDDREAECSGASPSDPWYHSAGCGGWTEEVCTYREEVTCTPPVCGVYTGTADCSILGSGWVGAGSYTQGYCTYADGSVIWDDPAYAGGCVYVPPEPTCTTQVLSGSASCALASPDLEGTGTYDYEYTTCTDGTESTGSPYNIDLSGCSPVACTSAANSCGMTNSGVLSGGVCNAVAPSDAACPSTPPVCVSNQGESCSVSSSANSCGMTNSNSGTIQCDGSCSASIPSAPSDTECIPGCSGGVLMYEGTECTVEASAHGVSSGSCSEGSIGSCNYLCLGGTWGLSSHTCDMLTDPELTTEKRDVRRGTSITFSYDTGGYTCDLRNGSTALFTGLVGSGTTGNIIVDAQRTYVLDCDGPVDPAITVRVLPIGFET